MSSSSPARPSPRSSSHPLAKRRPLDTKPPHPAAHTPPYPKTQADADRSRSPWQHPQEPPPCPTTYRDPFVPCLPYYPPSSISIYPQHYKQPHPAPPGSQSPPGSQPPPDFQQSPPAPPLSSSPPPPPPRPPSCPPLHRLS